MNTFRNVGAAIVSVCWISSPALAGGQNLLVNPDFSQGNTGFASQYQYTTFIDTEGQYTITQAGNINNVNFWQDWHNPGFTIAEYVLLANGAPTSVSVWSETVAVKPDTWYTFNYSAGDVNRNDTSDAILESTINGTSVSQLVTRTTAVQSSYGLWYSGADTSATINMIDLNADRAFNDFAFTDMYFGAPEPSTWAMMFAGFAGLALAGASRARTSRREARV